MRVCHQLVPRKSSKAADHLEPLFKPRRRRFRAQRLGMLGLATASILSLSTVAFPTASPAQTSSSSTTASGTSSSSSASLVVSTPYPNVRVQPGSTVTLNLAFESKVVEPVAVAVEGAPSGWTATLRGGGFLVNGVTATPDKANSVSLEVKVPATAKLGANTLTVLATDRTGDHRLPITLTVDAAAESAVSITTDFPEIKGKSTDTFTYSVNVQNNTPEKQVFNFDAKGPEGWEVSASPSSESRASTLSLDGGASGTVKVEAKPPVGIKAGTYPISLTVTNAAGQSANGAFSAVVSGTSSLKVALSDGRVSFSVRSGANTVRTLKVINDGSAPLSDVTLSASPPSDWDVTFDPATISSVAAGAETNVKMTLKPGKSALSGDYVVSTTASAGTATASAELRVTVKQSRWWGLIGVGLIAAALGVLWGVFRRFGRR